MSTAVSISDLNIGSVLAAKRIFGRLEREVGVATLAEHVTNKFQEG